MLAKTVQLEELPYRPDSCTLFERIRDLPAALLLDSGRPASVQGRYDILMADPIENVSYSQTNSTSYTDIEKYFAEIVKVHSSFSKGLVTATEEIPFCGGLAGYLDYDFGNPLQYLPATDHSEAQLHFYAWAVIQDHLLQRCTFVSLPALTSAQRNKVLERLRGVDSATTGAGPFQLRQPFQANLSREQYRQAHQRIQDYIQSGDCYQVNLAQRLESEFSGDPWEAYKSLRPVAAAHFAAYMQCSDEQAVLCLSPERFMRLNGRHVETRPIKGTRPRHADPASDQAAALALQQAPKDRAENLMIVDLLRNDIGRNCQPGSVRVDELFALESYPLVHHLVSSISGELRADRSGVDLLRDSFPGGSITGAPKRRAMQIIQELEPHRRRAYCGSVLYISADGRMDSNIAIRSLLCEADKIYCWAGGGIVADSQWQDEYQETWDKVGRLLQALEATLPE
jgi:para-aminobenzoate synthetase component 1